VPSGEAALNGGHCALPVDIMVHMKPCHFVVAALGLWAGLAGAQSASSQAKSSPGPARKAAVTVPFVGCASDGQAGPQAAPAGTSKAVAIAAGVAQRLAYYKAEDGPGVLAPRGWHCFSLYGSDGSILYVSPDPIDKDSFWFDANGARVDWKGFTGEAIQVRVSLGGTSGRFEVAKVVARVFPAYKSFAQSVIAEKLEPASDFPFGPYPNDKLAYRGNNVVEFETPANTDGLGTNSNLLKNASPIDGVAVIAGEDTNLVQLSARVAPADGDLISAMVKQMESDAASYLAQ
jgi:hypothetical protein